MKIIKNGYVAISSVIIIGAVILVIGLSVSFNAINEVQQSLGEEHKEVSLGSVESCAEDALNRIRLNDALPATITLPTGSCSVTINSHVGNNWTFTVSGTFSGHTKNIQVSATRTTQVTVVSWLEI